jgi:predicted transcriptional regulator
MTWKGYDFDIINKLDDEGYIRQGSHKSKSVVITEKGLEFSKGLLDKFNIDNWK